MPNIIRKYRRREGVVWKGRPTLYPIEWSREIAPALKAIERLRLTRIEPPAPEEIRRILLAVAPCIYLPHRQGVCPMGHSHDADEHRLKNMVVDVLYNSCGAHFINADDQPSLYISHFAGGTGTAATTRDMTALVNEVYRNTWNEEVELSSTEFNFSMFLGPEEGNGNFFHEWAAYAGDASLTLGSGLCFARWLYDFQKRVDRTLYGDYVLSKA